MGLRFVWMAVFIAVGIFIGIQAANNGIDRVNGPVAETSTQSSKAVEKPVQAEQTQQASESEETDKEAAADPWETPTRPTGLEKAANGAGTVVRKTAQKSLEAIEGLYNAVTD